MIKIRGRGTALLLMVNVALCTPIISMIVLKEDALLLDIFNPLHSSMNQQLFKRNLCSQSSHYENYRRFLLQMEAITCLLQNQNFLQGT